MTITKLKEEVNATKEENKELKDKNEILEEDAVYFIAGDIDASDVADDLGGENTVTEDWIS